MTRPDLPTLLAQCDAAGITVQWAPLPGRMWGLYRHTTRTITLTTGMTGSQEVAAPLHEMIHARRGDDGHQSPAVGARINREVAATLITWQEYAAAEAVSGGRGSGAIAAELDLPRWVVRAYRETLRNGRPNGRPAGTFATVNRWNYAT